MWSNFFNEIFFIKGYFFLMVEVKVNFKEFDRFFIYYILFCERFYVSIYRMKVLIVK